MKIPRGPAAVKALRSRVGIVFQDPDNQLFSADVYGEIAFGALNLGLSEKEVRRRVEKVMEELNLTALADKPVHLLSGGQKKLIAIADVLVMEPDIILLDEPSAALDPHNARLVDHVIDSLSLKGITVILSPMMWTEPLPGPIPSPCLTKAGYLPKAHPVIY